MANLPVLEPRQVAAILEAMGFREARQRGSHKQFRHPDGRATTVPFHGGRDISPILLRRIPGTSAFRWRICCITGRTLPGTFERARLRDGLRLPQPMLEQLRILANERDVPYQSLIKVFLAERIRKELEDGAA